MTGRPRNQNGYLRAENGSWLGTYRVYDGRGTGRRKTLNLGSTAEIKEKEAAALLRGAIRKDQEQNAACAWLGPLTKPRPLAAWKSGLNGAAIGAAAQLHVAADLITRGFDVYWPFSPVAAADLVYLTPEGKTVRVEVKSAEYQEGRSTHVDCRRNAGKFDVLAVVMRGGEIRYQAHSEIGRGIIKLKNSDQQSTSKDFANVANKDTDDNGDQ